MRWSRLIGLVTLAFALALGACGGEPADRAKRAALEPAIARELGARFGVAVTARCAWLGVVPIGCAAALPDATLLPIAIVTAGGAWSWRVPARVIATAPIAAYVAARLAALGIAQSASCGPAARIVGEPARLECALSGGGAAFVDIGADGTAAVELALDPEAATARRGPPPEGTLDDASHQLERTDGDE